MSDKPHIPKFGTGETSPMQGFTNTVTAARSWLQAVGLPIDAESFDRVAEIVGEAKPEDLADGFIIYGFDELQRLCHIGGFVIATPPADPDGSPVKAYTVGEWAQMQGELQ